MNNPNILNIRNKIFVLIFLNFTLIDLWSQPIIADHTFVAAYTSIPQEYIDLVKKRWLSYAGESHSEAIRAGLAALEDQDPKFAVSVSESGTPESATSDHLRVSRTTWGTLGVTGMWMNTYGEEDWWTNSTAITRTKEGITYCNENGFQLDYFAFGWCWDATSDNDLDGTYDPVYHTRWGGVTKSGPDGDLRWGLDADDKTHTGNSVCMDTYLEATRSYIEYCKSNGYPTKIFFTTGPIDNYNDFAVGELGYQQYLKWQRIRNYVDTTNFTLFDYADILSYNDAGNQQTTTWTDNNEELQTFPMIHPENMEGSYVAHIGMNGALKLAKAMWVLLATEEGWTGGPTNSNNNHEDIYDSYNIKLYPNPIKDQLTIKIPESNEAYLIEIYSLLGTLLIQKKIHTTYPDIKLSDLKLAEGNYFIKASNDKQNYISRFNVKF